EEATGMNRLVQDLLLLARSDAAGLNAAKERVPLAEVLRKAARVVPAEGGPRLGLQLPEEEVVVRGDRELLVRLVENLLENAARHTPEPGRIALCLSASGETACITVTDSGEGIPPEHLP